MILVCSWKNYYETDILDAWMYKYVQDNAMDKLVHANEFYEDLKEGTLPQFSYINPECKPTQYAHDCCESSQFHQVARSIPCIRPVTWQPVKC